MSSAPIDTQTKPKESISTQISILLDCLPQEPPTTQPPLDSTNNNGSNTDNTGNNNNGHMVDDNNNSNNGDNKDNDGNNRNGNLEEGNSNKGSSSGNDDFNKEVNDHNTGNNSQKKDLCECIRALLDKGKSSTKENNHSGKENSNKSSGGSSRKEGSNSRSPVEKLRTNLSKINDALTELGKIEEGDLGKLIQTQLDSLKKILDKKPASTTQTDEFEKINKEINKLKHKIPSLKKTPSVGSGANQISQLSNGSGPLRTVNGLLINPHESKELKSFQDSSFYKEIEQTFNGLDPTKKFFLSCFAVLPENEVVKRRLLIYWWVGEGLVKTTEEKSPEKIVDEYLTEFKEKGLIEPANKERRRQSTKSYRMHPLVRSAVVLLSQEAWLFGYDSTGKLTESVSPHSRVSLEEGSSKPENLDLEKLNTLFNVNEPYPDLKLGKLSKAKELSVAEWLMKMRKVKVLYLGRWQKSAEYHIEVESTEFLKGLRSMKELKLLSLQGMSRINEPPSAIGKLSSLMILDLKACHNLEVLPDEIASLKELRYMDISNCYLLDHMPRGLSSLSNLLVLKGFVIGSTQSGKKGTLDDLKGLKKLRKLTINTSTSEGFPTSKDILALHQLGTEGKLRKLTIAWGGSSNSKQGKGEGEAKLTKAPTAKPLPPRALFTLEKIKELPNKCCSKLPWGGGSKQGNDRLERRPTMTDAKLPEQLEKLDLQCFPEPIPPPWLNLGNLKSLKTLYIRGGRLKTLGNDEWSKVNTLCLKYLSEFKMNWRQLQQKFPGLNYLEKVDCPKITFCPCDENGVWLNPSPKQIEKKQSQENNVVG